jgi:hypothetical protein
MVGVRVGVWVAVGVFVAVNVGVGVGGHACHVQPELPPRSSQHVQVEPAGA